MEIPNLSLLLTKHVVLSRDANRRLKREFNIPGCNLAFTILLLINGHSKIHKTEIIKQLGSNYYNITSCLNMLIGKDLILINKEYKYVHGFNMRQVCYYTLSSAGIRFLNDYECQLLKRI